MRSWKDKAFVAALILGALGAIFSAQQLWLLLGPPDAIDGFVVHGGEVVIAERLVGGRRSLHGSRLVVLDLATGRVLTRVRSEHERVRGLFGGRLWLRNADGLEARDPGSLAVTSSTQDLVRAWPALAALGSRRVGCFDRRSGTERFPDAQGQGQAFDFASATLAASTENGCAGAETLVEHGLHAPELGADTLRYSRAVKGSTVTRRGPDGTTVVWSAHLTDKQLVLEQLEVHGLVVLVSFGQRVAALDLATGKELWRREP